MINEEQLRLLGFRPLSSGEDQWGRLGHYCHVVRYTDTLPGDSLEFHKAEVRNEPYPPEDEGRWKWRYCYDWDDLVKAVEDLHYYADLKDVQRGIKKL